MADTIRVFNLQTLPDGSITIRDRDNREAFADKDSSVAIEVVEMLKEAGML